MAEILTPAFWGGLMAIIGVNIVLSGDNAVVIALAARSLPPQQQKRAIAIGSGAAVVMRIILTIIAVEMLRWPYLKIIGSLLLLWIAIQLMQPEEEGDGEGESTTSVTLGAAIRTILIADLVMSLDNVLAVAAAAKGSLVLLVLGLAISIPLVVFGSTLLLKLMERFPVIITLGAALLGWVAGDMATTDPAVKGWVEASAPWLHEAAEVAGAVLVVLIGNLIAYRGMARRATEREQARAAAPAPARIAGAALFRKVLLAVDSSEPAARAVEYVLALRAQQAAPEDLGIRLINVQREVPGEMSRFVSKDGLADYRRERSVEGLARARAMLDAAGVKYDVHVGVGNPAEVISAEAIACGCDHVVMGTRGLGSYTGALLGSVAQAVAATCSVPVVLVK